MQKKMLWMAVVLISVSSIPLKAQYAKQDTTYGRFFIQPSVAITHRPYHTRMPDSFKQLDDKWSKFFIGEPGLHVGYNF